MTPQRQTYLTPGGGTWCSSLPILLRLLFNIPKLEEGVRRWTKKLVAPHHTFQQSLWMVPAFIVLVLADLVAVGELVGKKRKSKLLLNIQVETVVAFSSYYVPSVVLWGTRSITLL